MRLLQTGKQTETTDRQIERRRRAREREREGGGQTERRATPHYLDSGAYSE